MKTLIYFPVARSPAAGRALRRKRTVPSAGPGIPGAADWRDSSDIRSGAAGNDPSTGSRRPAKHFHKCAGRIRCRTAVPAGRATAGAAWRTIRSGTDCSWGTPWENGQLYINLPAQLPRRGLLFLAHRLDHDRRAISQNLGDALHDLG